MFNYRTFAIVAGILATLSAGVAQSPAQGGFFGLPPMGAMDTLNQGSTGAGAGGFALRQAQGLGAATGQPMTGFQPGGAPVAGAPAGIGGFGAMAPIVEEKKARVISGQRVYCRVTGLLLDDARVVYVTEKEAKDKYYDDGTHGDPIPQDGVYANIGEERDDVISLDADILRRRIQGAVIQAEGRSPLDFYMLHAVTIEPVSLVPNEISLEEERDGKVYEWANKFLKQYRVNEEDPRSEFWPLFIPAPPAIPASPFPPGFDLTRLPPELGGTTANQAGQGEEEVMMEEDDSGEDDSDDSGGSDE